MDFGENIKKPCVAGVSPNIETKAVRVLITTDDYEIDGYLHIKPGGYQSRVSDILNAKGLQYLPLTNATYRSLRNPDELVRKVETLIIRIDTIKMVAPQNGAEFIAKDIESDAAESEKDAGDKSELPKTGNEY